jgi:hypothetical protein
MSITPDTEAAVRFLEWAYPEGPWLIFAKPDGQLLAQTFWPATRDKMVEFISTYNGVTNMYWSINPPMTTRQKKAKKEDLKELRFLHVDIDAEAGESVPDEMFRIKALLFERFPKDQLPDPSCVLMSGGGYWCFWRLETPVPINGDKAICEELERYNLHIAHILGGDNCHNADRIARLPGTINLPDAKKVAKGRTECLAEAVYTNDRAYPLTAFKQAPKIQSGDDGFTGSTIGKVDISGNVPKILSLDELDQYKLPDRTKVIIVNGQRAMERFGPKIDGKDNSRSGWLFEGVCSMVKHGVPDEVIYSILMDPDWGISESIVDKGSTADKHARKTISSAKEYTHDPNLAELNRRFAVIASIGGKCRVVEEVEDLTLGRTRLIKQTFEDFKNRYCHERIEMMGKDGPVYIPKGKWWIENKDRRQYDRIEFAPNKERPGVYNLWRGFAYEPRPGDCSLYLQHLKEVVCGGDETHYQYLIHWMARAVQYPERPGEVAIVLRGEQGTGKGLTIKIFGNLFGRHFLQIADSKHLIGNFNSHLRDAVIVFADEAFYAGDKKHESILKTLVTEPTLLIEGKGVDAEVTSNCIHLMMASNSAWVVPAGDHERRYFVLDVANTKRQNSAHFGAMMKQMETGGYSALLLHLNSLNVKPDAFDVRDMPRTKALGEQQEFTLSMEDSWWFEKLQRGKLLPEDKGWADRVVKDALYNDYIEFCKRLNVTRRLPPHSWNNYVRKHLGGEWVKRQENVTFWEKDDRGVKTERRERAYVVYIPGLVACREAWDKIHGPRAWGLDEPIQTGPESVSRSEKPF